MQLLGQTLRRLSVSHPVRRSNLSVFPLFDPAPATPTISPSATRSAPGSVGLRK